MDDVLQALRSLVHRCHAEGVGTAWADLKDAEEVLARYSNECFLCGSPVDEDGDQCL